jgi:hypothetical protein
MEIIITLIATLFINFADEVIMYFRELCFENFLIDFK